LPVLLLADAEASAPIANAFALARSAIPAIVNTVPPVIVTVIKQFVAGIWAYFSNHTVQQDVQKASPFY
jgi:hypothetical protein